MKKKLSAVNIKLLPHLYMVSGKRKETEIPPLYIKNSTEGLVISVRMGGSGFCLGNWQIEPVHTKVTKVSVYSFQNKMAVYFLEVHLLTCKFTCPSTVNYSKVHIDHLVKCFNLTLPLFMDN